MAHSVNSSITASPSFVEAAERGQVSASEGSVRHAEVLPMGGVRTPITGRPRPLPGDRRADPPYTLNCEEPANLLQERDTSCQEDHQGRPVQTLRATAETLGLSERTGNRTGRTPLPELRPVHRGRGRPDPSPV